MGAHIVKGPRYCDHLVFFNVHLHRTVHELLLFRRHKNATAICQGRTRHLRVCSRAPQPLNHRGKLGKHHICVGLMFSVTCFENNTYFRLWNTKNYCVKTTHVFVCGVSNVKASLPRNSKLFL